MTAIKTVLASSLVFYCVHKKEAW